MLVVSNFRRYLELLASLVKFLMLTGLILALLFHLPQAASEGIFILDGVKV